MDWIVAKAISNKMTKISTQFLFRISFQQFVVATTGRRGSSIASQTKAITWNGNMKSKKHVQSRKELECKEFGMIQARQQKPKNYVVLKQQSAWRHSQIQKSGEKIMGSAGKSKKGQNIRWPDHTAQANVRDEKGKNRNKALLHYGIEDFICSPSFVDIETFYAGK